VDSCLRRDPEKLPPAPPRPDSRRKAHLTTRLAEAYNTYVICTPVLTAGVPSELIQSAQDCRYISDFSNVLRTLADLMGAKGCILWEKLDFGPDGRLFALAEHFPGKPSWHFLPTKSVTGEALHEGRRKTIDDVERAIAEGRVPMGDLFRQKGVRAFCCIPVEFHARGMVVNLYWTEDHVFHEEELDRIEAASKAIPYLFGSLRNETGSLLLRFVDKRLNTHSGTALKEILDEVTAAFNAVESAIYLEDPLAAPRVYTKREIVWPWSWDWEKEYRWDDDTMASWAIRNRRTIRFFDLAEAPEESRFRDYSGLHCRNSGRLIESAMKHFQCGRESLPPLSFLCVPIQHQNRALGIIRCTLTKLGPYWFDDGHLQILQYVADKIGEWWGTNIDLQGEREEKLRLQSLTDGIGRLNQAAFDEINKSDGPSLDRQMHRILDLLSRISGFGEALSVRFIDPVKRQSSFKAVLGSRWAADGDRKQSERFACRISLADEAELASSVSEKRATVYEGPPRGAALDSPFPEATRTLHATVLARSEVIGVLDVRGFGDRPFPPSLKTIVCLLAQQLGMYHHMFQQFSSLQDKTDTLRRSLEQQGRTYQDFHHQISDPIKKAHNYAARVMTANPALEHVRALRANARFAEHVADNLKAFIRLGKDLPPEATLEKLEPQELVARIRELAEDSESVSSYTGKLRFRVNEESFRFIGQHIVRADLSLLHHALMNLLDNAAKYGVKDSTVTVRATDAHTHCRIAVLNQSKYPVTTSDRKRLFEYEFRGDGATSHTEGSGIGLFIVKKFMESMKGDADAIPTDSSGITEFRLSLPCV
jgi:signal transduction histidine kinase